MFVVNVLKSQVNALKHTALEFKEVAATRYTGTLLI